MNTLKRYLSGLSPLAMVLCAFMSLTLLAGCGGGSSADPSSGSSGGTTTPVTPTPLVIYGSESGNVGQTLSFLVAGGTPEYSVISSISSVAAVSTVSKSGNLYIFTATLSSKGITSLIVTDANNTTKTLSLTVNELPLKTTAPSAVNVVTSSSVNYTISGGNGFYSASSSNESVAKASVSLFGSILTINGLSAGTATITVCDAWCASTVTINVTVGSSSTPIALYTTAPSNVSMLTSETATYSIAGGTSPYTANSSSTSVASTTVNGSELKVTAKTLLGSASIVVTDSLGATVTIAVTVASNGVPFSTTAPLAITLPATGTAGQQTYTNSGGTAPYTCTSDKVSVVTASCSGSSMVITGVADGVAKVLVQDATGTASKTIEVNVATGTGFTASGAGNWTVPSAHCNAPFTAYDPPIYSVFFINGGTPPYTVTANSPLVGTIIGAGTTSSPLATPSGAKPVSTNSVTVQQNGYFVVAWPDADVAAPAGPDNHCAEGSTTFKITDANNTVLPTSPTFAVNVQ